MLRLTAPAKLNLHLEILAREDSGYHQLETLFCELELADELEFSETAGGVALAVAVDDDNMRSALGPDDDNLVLRAARLYQGETGTSGGVTIRLHKQIPVGAGLGGGSSDAAATLMALDRLNHERLGPEGRIRLAARLGSDVPFFLCGSPLALAWGRGDRLLPLEPLPPLPVLLLVPPLGSSTRDAYAALDRRREQTGSAAQARVLRPARLTDWDYLAQHAFNDFEEVLFERFPALAAARQCLLQEGALLARLTGSGSTVFGVFRDHTRLLRAVEAATHMGLRSIATRTAYPPSPPPFG